MDWVTNDLESIAQKTLRGYLVAKYQHKLPPLKHLTLANTIGISCIIFFYSKDQLTPYLPIRNKALLNKNQNELAVFEGGFHCTASGVLEWKNTDSSINYFINEMQRELEEEVGLTKNDLKFLYPLSICREFLRGGKPQIFFIGLTLLNEKEIISKRKEALKKITKEEKIEIKDEHLLIKNNIDLKELSKKYTLTMEAIANLYYCEKFINEYNQIINERK